MESPCSRAMTQTSVVSAEQGRIKIKDKKMSKTRILINFLKGNK